MEPAESSPPSAPAPVEGVAAPEALAAWRAAFSGLMVAAAPPEEDARACTVAVRSGPQFVLSEVASPRLRCARPEALIAAGTLDHFAVRLGLSGSVRGLAGGQPFTAGEGDVVIADLLQPLDLDLAAGAAPNRDVTLWIPRRIVMAGVAEEHLLHGLVLAGRTAPGAVLGAALAALAARREGLSAEEFDALARGVAELAMHAVAPMLARHPEAGAAAPTASFVTVRRFIDRRLASHQLGPELIARTFGLSRASLYRLFEPVGGVVAYIRDQRLARARDEIVAPGLSNRRIGPIAYRWGFKSVSAFNRVFRDAYGMTPLQARGAVRDRPGELPADMSGELGTIARLLAATKDR